MRLAVVGALTLAFVACESKPTKVSETQSRALLQVAEKAQKPLVLTEDEVVLDARSSFEFGLNHIRNSYLFPWTNLAEDPRKGEVIRDLHQASVRLALLGLKPETTVLVVGNGINGQGEEGRLAWTLLLLGYQDVQVSAVEAFRPGMTQDPSQLPQNVFPARLRLREEMQIGTDDFIKGNFTLIDVRSAKEFESAPKDHPALNIEWKSFYSAKGRPDLHFVRKLHAQGLNEDKPIVVISNRGVRSGAAAYALLAMGYRHVQNFTAGWNGLTHSN